MRTFDTIKWNDWTILFYFLIFPLKVITFIQTNIPVIGCKAVQANGNKSVTNKTYHYRHYQVFWIKHFHNTRRFGCAPNGITWGHWGRIKKWVSVSLWTSWTGVGQARDAERKSTMLEPRSPSAASWTGWRQQ